MTKFKKSIIVLIFTWSVLLSFHVMGKSVELPKPDYNNSMMFSLIYPMPDTVTDDFQYILDRFGNGLYAPLTVSTYKGIDLIWGVKPIEADAGLKEFKNDIDNLITKAKSYNVGIHLILMNGLSRDTELYNYAEQEDMRNAQWYNDNNVASQEQMNTQYPEGHGPLNSYVYGTLSRYARKMRTHLEAKVKAAFDYLAKVQKANPDVTIIVSAPGEPELNSSRMNPDKALQDYFCDYSPFSVLEFQDWIKHTGMYGEGEKYEGQGYEKGGSQYVGRTGLQKFNQDFGTNFVFWTLKYFRWSLSDPDGSDQWNDTTVDPHSVPYDLYKQDEMMPSDGNYFMPGGFDAPRKMKSKGEDAFWDLWQLFREMQVHHYVKDMAEIALKSGFQADHYFTHQIPADYIGGTRPGDSSITLNSRYYTSASPLWTASNLSSRIGLGVSIYDEKYDHTIFRTSLYSVPALASLSKNWGATEYNPDVVTTGNINDVGTTDSIYPQVMRLYDYNAHLISFFKWEGNIAYRFKDTNRELAIKQFFDAVKDKARGPITEMFSPISVSGFKGKYVVETTAGVKLEWSSLIWSDLKYKWSDWGDFKEFVIYRGTTSDFICNNASEITHLTGLHYVDHALQTRGINYYYKISAVNVNGELGQPVSVNVYVPPAGTSIINLSTEKLNFGGTTAGIVSDPRIITVSNIGEGVMNWQVSKNVSWLECTPASGKNTGEVKISVNAAGLTPGEYTAIVTVQAEKALEPSRTIDVTFRIYEDGKDAAPFGTFETPDNGGQVDGMVSFTGYAVDDIGIDRVKIYFKNGDWREYICDAFILENSRPDIEAAFKDYPGTNRSGWGFTVSMDLFPVDQNTHYKFYAVAVDKTGHETLFQSRVVITDVSLNTKPFGAIETPASGETISGKDYINWGWVLAQKKNYIPSDGSTISVLIDGVNVGHPVYNLKRDDLANRFTGYANSEGALGYFVIDTTKLSNGLHSIVWIATDNEGHSEGIGSRYFYVKN